MYRDGVRLSKSQGRLSFRKILLISPWSTCEVMRLSDVHTTCGLRPSGLWMIYNPITHNLLIETFHSFEFIAQPRYCLNTDPRPLADGCWGVSNHRETRDSASALDRMCFRAVILSGLRHIQRIWPYHTLEYCCFRTLWLILRLRSATCCLLVS